MYYKINHSSYNTFEKFFRNRYIYYLLLALTFLEASFWFIIPDFFILLFSYFTDKNRYKYALGFVAATTFGIIFYTYFVSIYKGTAYNILINTPFVTEYMLESTQIMLNNNAFTSLLTQSISGIPVKVWTHSVINLGLNIPYFIALVTISRTLRILFIVFIGDSANKYINRTIKNNFILIFLGYLVLFFTGLSLIF